MTVALYNVHTPIIDSSVVSSSLCIVPLYSINSIVLCDNGSAIIGERERAYLVVQLARFFCLFILSGVDVCRNVLRNSK